jgi:hypothetical protein
MISIPPRGRHRHDARSGDAGGAVLGDTVAPVTLGLGSIAAVLADADAGGGFGTITLDAYLTLAIPPATPSGVYTAVLTLTADPAGP